MVRVHRYQPTLHQRVDRRAGDGGEVLHSGIRSGGEFPRQRPWIGVGVIVSRVSHDRPRRATHRQTGVGHLAERRKLVRLVHPVGQTRQVLEEESVEVVGLRARRIAWQYVAERQRLQVAESARDAAHRVLGEMRQRFIQPG